VLTTLGSCQPMKSQLIMSPVLAICCKSGEYKNIGVGKSMTWVPLNEQLASPREQVNIHSERMIFQRSRQSGRTYTQRSENVF
jgi:hypothetical protein